MGEETLFYKVNSKKPTGRSCRLFSWRLRAWWKALSLSELMAVTKPSWGCFPGLEMLDFRGRKAVWEGRFSF